MTVNANSSFEYPVLRFVRGMVFPARDPIELTHCMKTALKNGFFSGQLLIDSSGNAFKIQGAKKLRGVGPFWGYNIFLNRRIEVDLIVGGKPEQMDIKSLKERVLKALRSRQGWDASDDTNGLAGLVEQADSIAKIANIVTDAYYRKYPR